MSTSTATKELTARQSIELERKISESDWTTAYDTILKPTLLGGVRISGFSCINNRKRAAGEDLDWCERVHGNIFSALLCACDFAIRCVRAGEGCSLRDIQRTVAVRWGGADWDGGDQRDNVMWNDKLPASATQVLEMLKLDPAERLTALEEKKREILWMANRARELSMAGVQNLYRSPEVEIIAPNKAERELILQKKAAFEAWCSDKADAHMVTVNTVSRQLDALYDARQGARVVLPVKKAFRAIREIRAALKAEV